MRNPLLYFGIGFALNQGHRQFVMICFRSEARNRKGWEERKLPGPSLLVAHQSQFRRLLPETPKESVENKRSLITVIADDGSMRDSLPDSLGVFRLLGSDHLFGGRVPRIRSNRSDQMLDPVLQRENPSRRRPNIDIEIVNELSLSCHLRRHPGNGGRLGLSEPNSQLVR
jgi:hypothetical protein